MRSLTLIALLLCCRASAADAPSAAMSAPLKREARQLLEDARGSAAVTPAALDKLRAAEGAGALDDEAQAWLVEAELLLDKSDAPADRTKALLDAAARAASVGSFDGRTGLTASPVAVPATSLPPATAPLLETATALLAKTGRAGAGRAQPLAEKLTKHLSLHPRRDAMKSRRLFVGRDGRLRLAYRVAPRTVVIEDLGPFADWAAGGAAGSLRLAARPSKPAAKKPGAGAASEPKGGGGGGGGSGRSRGTKGGSSGAHGGAEGRARSPADRGASVRTAYAGKPAAAKTSSGAGAARAPRAAPAARSSVPHSEAFDESSRRTKTNVNPAKETPHSGKTKTASGKAPQTATASKKGVVDAPKGTRSDGPKAGPSAAAAGPRASAASSKTTAAPERAAEAPASLTAPVLAAKPEPLTEWRDALNGSAATPSPEASESRMIGRVPSPPPGSGEDSSPAAPEPLPGALLAGTAAALLAGFVQIGSSALGRRNSERTKPA